ncbi:MAG TPA: ABC transporter permease [Bryobacteraceae bacterium]|jgi:predicted permease|nr:ABC transporter permease [Bryobacteraceae bacterium]
MLALLADLRLAVRALARNRGLTAVIVLSLALGIGANTALFSVADALFLKPLPYPEADRLAVLWLRAPGIGIPQDWPSPGEYIDIVTQNHSFSEVAISQGRNLTIAGLDEPERVDGLATSSNLFTMLGAKPLYGRVLLPQDDAPGQPAVAVLSYGIWRRLFHADPNIVGRGVTLNNTAYTVAGVLRPEFRLNHEAMQTVNNIDRCDIYLPLPLAADAVNRRGDENYNLTARLKPGVSLAQAQADIAVIAGRIREKDKRDRSFTIGVVSLVDQVVGNLRRIVLVLFAAVGLVLLIACANVANLLLSRATGREKEIAVRTALGAGRWALVRQLLAESVVLGLAGGTGGVAIALAALQAVRTINPGNIPRLEDIRIDGGVLGFTFAVSVITGILFGLAPALRAAHVDLNSSLKSGGRGSQGAGGFRFAHHRLRSLLVVSEVAVSLMLLTGAGLLVRSFIQLSAVPPGFQPGHVLSLRVAAIGTRYHEAAGVREFYRQVTDRIAHLPGAQSSGLVSALPLTPTVGWGGISVEGFTPAPGQEFQSDMRTASPDYFRTMEIPLMAGRFFGDHDTPDSRPVAIVDQTFARRFWPHGDAVGKHIWFDPKDPYTIVGVVGTVKEYGLDTEGKAVTYFSSTRNSSSVAYLVVRTTADPAALTASVVREIHAIDPTVAVYDVQTMDGRVYESLARPRFATAMLSVFALFALALAAVGVYGVMSFQVTQSAHDIGVRLALGAGRGDIVGMVVRQGMLLVGAGAVVGLACAALLTSAMATLLFGVSAHDLTTFGAVTAFLLLTALVASYIPALRATRLDPLAVLRDE